MPDHHASPALRLGFSGHRALEHREQIAAAIHAALDHLAHPARAITAICSAASGADTLLLEVLSARGIRYDLVLPFPLPRFREDFSPADWQRAEPLIKAAASTVVVAARSADDEPYLPATRHIAEHCDVLLVLWNGLPGKPGGTGDAVRIARQRATPILIIDPETGALREERPIGDAAATHRPRDLKRILALDGGGIRGIFTLQILARIEQLLRQQHGKPDLVLADVFHMMAGTSTGAIMWDPLESTCRHASLSIL